MSNRELSVICLRWKISVVYKLFREEKPPIPHLRPVSLHYPTTEFLLISQGVSVLVKRTPFQVFLSNLP